MLPSFYLAIMLTTWHGAVATVQVPMRDAASCEGQIGVQKQIMSHDFQAADCIPTGYAAATGEEFAPWYMVTVFETSHGDLASMATPMHDAALCWSLVPIEKQRYGWNYDVSSCVPTGYAVQSGQ